MPCVRTLLTDLARGRNSPYHAGRSGDEATAIRGAPVAEGGAQSLHRVRFVGLPRRDEAGFRRQAQLTLVLAATLGAALAAYATANGYADFTPVMVAIAVVPLLGGLVGLWRLLAAWEAGPGRGHAVLAAFSLGLVS
jgi:hypothetical protein